MQDFVHNYMTRWFPDLGKELGVEDWSAIWQSFKSSSVNVNALEVNYTVMMRWYCVPTQMHKAFPTASPLCFQGCDSRGKVHHIWWECPKVWVFWSKVLSLGGVA